jgi:hypothetical protein
MASKKKDVRPVITFNAMIAKNATTPPRRIAVTIRIEWNSTSTVPRCKKHTVHRETK